jgi:CubicO group peptidase (beta-lactamase class C family)
MKKHSIISALFLIFALIININAQDKSSKIDELVQKYYELGQVNGSVLVAEDGNIIYSKGVGMADMELKIPNKTDTKFRLASVTKQFTAALIMQLVEKDKIKLDGKLSDYLPYYRKDVGEKVTIHQLLNHTSGIPSYTEDQKFMRDQVSYKVEVKDFVLKYCSGDLAFEPGTKWSYSNSAYYILGAIIEEVTGKDYGSVLNENILAPLGMTNSGYENSDSTYENKAKGYNPTLAGIVPARNIDMTVPFSAGGMYSTVEDMYKWDQALYTEKILTNESKEKIFTPYLHDYGYGWEITEQQVGDTRKKIITHSGGIFGFRTIIVRFAEDKKLIVILNNLERASYDELANGIANILYGFEPKAPKKNLARILFNSINDKGVDDAVKEFRILKDMKDEYMITENDMNNLGYMFLQHGKAKEAIEIFKLNVEMHPDSWNVYDSLGEAYMNEGDNELALENYRKSVEMNPDNENGKEIIKKLEKNK